MASCEPMQEEWNEFFAASIFPTPLELFVQISSQETQEQEKSASKESLLCFLGKLNLPKKRPFAFAFSFGSVIFAKVISFKITIL